MKIKEKIADAIDEMIFTLIGYEHEMDIIATIISLIALIVSIISLVSVLRR